VKVLFAGTPVFALPSLDRIAGSSRHTLVGVLTRPDRPRARGRRLLPSPVKERGLALGLPILQPARPSAPETLEGIARLGPDVVAVVAFGRILKPAFLRLPRFGCVNLHASLLPLYRGAAPIERALLDGRTETGVTTMQIAEGLDTGDILLSLPLPIGPEETAGELAARLAEAGADLLLETLDRIERGECPRRPQEHEKATYASPVRKEDARIDWSRDAGSIQNLVRAMNPKPIAETESAHGMLRVYRVLRAPGAGPPGTVLAADPKSGLVVAAGEGAVRLAEVQLPGRKRMEDRALLSGVRFAAGRSLAEGA